MNRPLSGMEALLLWKLALSGGAFQKDMKPPVTKPLRDPLVDAGLIDKVKQKPPLGNRTADFLSLSDAGWAWLSEHVDAALSPTAKTNETLQTLLSRLKRFLEVKNVALVDFLDPPARPSVDGDARDLPGQVVRACLHLTGGRENARVRLADLRETLSGITRTDLDATLLAMAEQGEISLYRLDDPLEVQDRDRAAMIRTPSGEDRHILYCGGHRG